MYIWDGERWTVADVDDPRSGAVGSSGRDEVLESQVMLDEARRSLDSQRTDLSNVKARTSTLLGVSGLILPLASRLAAGDSNRAFSILALLAFLIAVCYAGYVLWPHILTFEVETDQLIATRDRSESTEHYLRSVAASLGSYRQQNVPVMSNLTAAYMATGVFVGLEVVALALGAVVG